MQTYPNLIKEDQLKILAIKHGGEKELRKILSKIYGVEENDFTKEEILMILKTLRTSFIGAAQNRSHILNFEIDLEESMLKNLPKDGLINNAIYTDMNVKTYIYAFKRIRVKEDEKYINGFTSEIVENFDFQLN